MAGNIDEHSVEREWHSNGKIKSVDVYLNGRKHGLCTKYAETGIVILKQEYQNGERHGGCWSWWPNGEERGKCLYLNDILHGDAVEYYANGHKELHAQYKMGVPTGIWRRWDETGKIVSLTEYDAFGKVMRVMRWDPETRKCTTTVTGTGSSGTRFGYKKLREKKICKLLILGINNEHRTGIVEKLAAKHRCSKAIVLTIYDMFDHTPSEHGTSIHDGNFEYTVGEILEIHDYNKDYNVDCTRGIHYFLSEECAYFWEFNEYEARKMNWSGLFKAWDTNGNLALHGNFVDGLRNGPWSIVTWYNKVWPGSKDPYIIEVINYQMGKRHGDFLRYDSRNAYFEQGQYIMDKQEGEWVTIDDSVQTYKCFKNDILNGPWWQQCPMDKGCGVGNYLIESGEYLNGKRYGKFTTWYSDGSLGKTVRYVDGRKRFKVRKWLRCGSIKFPF